MKKFSWEKLLLAIAIPLVVGALSAFFSGGMAGYANFEKPPLSPPAWLFPVAWTVLYILMGIASYLVYEKRPSDAADRALKVYAVSLFFNFFWSIIFFRFSAYLFAFLWLLGLWISVLVTLILFFKIRKAAGALMIPYLLWVTFAGYLNYMIYLFN